jgi:ABC-2 type transport system permease protein
MTNPNMALSDSATILRRDLRHAVSFPATTLSGLLVPVLFLLLFDGVFGRTLRGGLGATITGGYVQFVVPGVLVMAAASVAEATALHVNTDMSGGIIARFRTMAIWRPAVLVGQVSGSVIRTLLTGAAVCAVGIGLGFAPHTTALGWLAAAGLFALLGLALSWLTTAFGLLAKTPSGANSLSLILLLLPFISSAFVPTARMPAGVREFAEYQPFSSIIDTLRGLLVGGPIGGHAVAAVAWCGGIAIVGFWWSTRLYERRPAAEAAAG